jgi:DNA invertase Pin-like site-specific DNA recombinase
MIAALVRVSTELQDPESQRQAIIAAAARDGLTIDRWFDEGNISGALDESARPVLAEFMAAVRAKQIGTLLISEWSRLGRDALGQLQRALELQRAGVQVIALDDRKTYDLDDPDDLLLFFILCWKDHRSRVDTKRRTKAAFHKVDGVTVSRRHGKRTGTPGFTWTRDVDEQLLDLAACGMSAAEIAASGINVVRRRGFDADGRFASVTGKIAVEFHDVLEAPKATAVKGRIRYLRSVAVAEQRT